MLSSHRYFYIARISIELEQAMSLCAGLGMDTFDTELARDHNGLPTLPGSSIAGVFRTLYQLHYDNEVETDSLFGFSQRKGNDSGDVPISSPSFVHFSWGHMHDKEDKPLQNLIEHISDLDELCQLAAARGGDALNRDRVRLNHRGVVDERGKFDRVVLPAGYRFSFEVSLWSERNKDERWQKLLHLVSSPQLRFGGATRSGFGKVRPLRIHQQCFDLHDSHNYENFSGLGSDVGDIALLTQFDEEIKQENALATWNCFHYQLKLKARDFWCFGGGTEAIDDTWNGKLPDKLPKTEIRVIGWENKNPKFKSFLLIPESGIKGALLHRTAFYYNCLTDNFATSDSDDYDVWENPAVKRLFGYAKKDEESPGQAGCLFFHAEPVSLEHGLTSSIMMHNSIDRFTGGVRDGMLFSEEMIFGNSINFSIELVAASHINIDAKIKQAFLRALNDLETGQLALGSGSSKGHGVFEKESSEGNLKPWLAEEEV